ncbi:MAG: DivIVA domain-containing protein [Desulfobulbaceae bacterium]|nr:DivIVA domain-containing protein [Desulfobulbaceae bacterium]
MTITPQDIQSKQFHVRMRGFDMDEVDKFLEKVAEELLVVSLENKQILEKIETMEKELANYRNKEQAFQSAILSAQRISDEMQSQSRQESDELVMNAKKEAEELESGIRQEVDELLEKSRQEAADLRVNAETEAQQILEDSQKEHHELTNNINHLIEIKGRVMTDMRQLLNNYLDHIDEAIPSALNALEPLPQIEEFNPATQEEEPITLVASEDIADHDLEDLYEKIELPEQTDQVSLDDPDQPVTLDLTDIEPLEIDDDGNLAPSIPITDLEGEEEMLFSFEDPLDELEPSVSISEDDKPG